MSVVQTQMLKNSVTFTENKAADMDECVNLEAE